MVVLNSSKYWFLIRLHGYLPIFWTWNLLGKDKGRERESFTSFHENFLSRIDISSSHFFFMFSFFHSCLVQTMRKRKDTFIFPFPMIDSKSQHSLGDLALFLSI